jgi:hypothetical protein
MPRDIAKFSLQPSPDEAIPRLARALARQAAREDHERNSVRKGDGHEESSDLRYLILDRALILKIG